MQDVEVLEAVFAEDLEGLELQVLADHLVGDGLVVGLAEVVGNLLHLFQQAMEIRLELGHHRIARLEMVVLELLEK